MFYEAPNLAENPAAFEAIWDEAYENVATSALTRR